MYNEAFIDIEDHCVVTAKLTISHFGMSSPNRNTSDVINTDINLEMKEV